MGKCWVKRTEIIYIVNYNSKENFYKIMSSEKLSRMYEFILETWTTKRTWFGVLQKNSETFGFKS